MRKWLIYFFIIISYAPSVWAEEAGGIEGKLLMLDNMTPHVAIVIQAVKPAPDGSDEPIVIATTLSDENGDYHFTSLRRCTWELRINRLHYNTAIYSAEVDSPALPWLKEL